MSAKLIRAWLNLKEQEDGATEQQIADAIGSTQPNVHDALKRMVDCYIDRWPTPTTRVWIAVKIPPHCPPPAKRKATA